MRFGPFDVDPAAGELRRDGRLVKLQDLPFRVLVALLTHRGAVVSREQLRAELWGHETFVDAEAGLNTAIAKLRDALGDRADSPTYIETLPKRGYRFKSSDAAPPVVVSAARRRWLRWRVPLVAAAILTLAAIGWGRWHGGRERIVIAVVQFHNETGDAANDRLAQQLTDATVVALAADPRYAVIGNAAILRTPRIFSDITAIGRALDAGYLVLGQLQNAGGGLIVRAHFIRVSDQTHLWAAGVPGTPADLDARVPTAVAGAVRASLPARR